MLVAIAAAVPEITATVEILIVLKAIRAKPAGPAAVTRKQTVTPIKAEVQKFETAPIFDSSHEI